MAKKEAPTINTERLVLRRLTENDIPAMSKLFGSKKVTKYLAGDTPTPDARSMLKLVQARREHDWAVTLSETGEYIGQCIIARVTADYLGEIGCLLLPDFWKKGYAKEALSAVEEYCVNTLNLKRLCARMDNGNGGAKKLFESLGYELNAVLPEASFIGRICDVAYYSKKI